MGINKNAEVETKEKKILQLFITENKTVRYKDALTAVWRYKREKELKASLIFLSPKLCFSLD